MASRIILASGSQIRGALLSNAGINYEVMVPRIDEQTIKDTLQTTDTSPSDIAVALARAKASTVAHQHPDAFVIGCDQLLEYDGALFSKPTDRDDASCQLRMLSGQTHHLITAASICHGGRELWHHHGQVALNMRALSDRYITDYVTRNWDSIRHAVGCYKLEEEGIRLFTSIQGDYFHVLGMPMLEILNFLTERGELVI